MKLFIKSIRAIALLLLISGNLLAQSGSGSNQTIPEMIFQNPTLISGIAKQDGAVYRFKNVATNIDATVKIIRRSSAAVVLTNIDVPDLGYSKALQPQLGIMGNVAPDQNWWMEFEMQFFKAGTNNNAKIKNFNVTALDVDGDGRYIQEYVQMNKVKQASCSPVTYLVPDDSGIVPYLAALFTGFSGYNVNGFDKKMQGPKQNFVNIDTTATSVMSTYTYEDKDMITFVIGAKSSGGTSNAGERLNSLWFKSFNLTQPYAFTLPVKLTSFNALLEDKNVLLSWSSATEENFSHYVVERSIDGKNYSDAAVVFAAGNSSLALKYQYKDKNIASTSGTVYYRLRLVETTGEVSYSDIRIIKLSKETQPMQLTTYPNPAREELKVRIPGSWQGKAVQMELFTANGERVQSMQVNNAGQIEAIRLSTLPTGFYLIKAVCNGQSAQQRIIKD